MAIAGWARSLEVASYDYPEGEPKQLWPGLKTFARGAKAIAEQDIVDRLLYARSVAAARCVERGEVPAGPISGAAPIDSEGALQFINRVGVASSSYVRRSWQTGMANVSRRRNCCGT
jgi:3-hydroxyacyl-CoA dehydrogenase/enoyl-CoA hydratase/3-hydroxybutyryl-CoA epimerase